MNYDNSQFLISPLKWVSTGFSAASNRLTGRPCQTPTYVRTGSDARLWKYNRYYRHFFCCPNICVLIYFNIYSKTNCQVKYLFTQPIFTEILFYFLLYLFQRMIGKTKDLKLSLTSQVPGMKLFRNIINFSAKYRIFE